VRDKKMRTKKDIQIENEKLKKQIVELENRVEELEREVLSLLPGKCFDENFERY
jgi:hypothetical protein